MRARLCPQLEQQIADVIHTIAPQADDTLYDQHAMVGSATAATLAGYAYRMGARASRAQDYCHTSVTVGWKELKPYGRIRLGPPGRRRGFGTLPHLAHIRSRYIHENGDKMATSKTADGFLGCLHVIG